MNRFPQPEQLEAFRCPCCMRLRISRELIESMILLEAELSLELTVLSGFLCPAQAKRGGEPPDTPHAKGWAVHAKSDVAPGEVIRQAAEAVPFFKGGGIGKAAGWVHLDVGLNPQRFSE